MNPALLPEIVGARGTIYDVYCTTNFDRWIYTLKNMERLKDIPYQPYMAVFKQLSEITDIAAMSKEDCLRYDESIKIYRDNLATLDFAEKKGMEKGRKEGEQRKQPVKARYLRFFSTSSPCRYPRDGELAVSMR